MAQRELPFQTDHPVDPKEVALVERALEQFSEQYGIATYEDMWRLMADNPPLRSLVSVVDEPDTRPSSNKGYDDVDLWFFDNT